MTDEELTAHAHRIAEESAARQGLPPKITDRVALAKIAALVRGAKKAQSQKAAS